MLSREIPNAFLVLCLSGGAQYAAMAATLERAAPPNCRVLHDRPRAEIHALAHLADCIVFPSLSEGFGYGVLEAVATGTPVVATRTTSIPEVIHGKHVLVPPRDPAAISRAVVEVSQARYARTPEKRFAWDENITAHIQLYHELLS